MGAGFSKPGPTHPYMRSGMRRGSYVSYHYV
jgi:hypothetical protein